MSIRDPKARRECKFSGNSSRIWTAGSADSWARKFMREIVACHCLLRRAASRKSHLIACQVLKPDPACIYPQTPLSHPHHTKYPSHNPHYTNCNPLHLVFSLFRSYSNLQSLSRKPRPSIFTYPNHNKELQKFATCGRIPLVSLRDSGETRRNHSINSQTAESGLMYLLKRMSETTQTPTDAVSNQPSSVAGPVTRMGISKDTAIAVLQRETEEFIKTAVRSRNQIKDFILESGREAGLLPKDRWKVILGGEEAAANLVRRVLGKEYDRKILHSRYRDEC